MGEGTPGATPTPGGATPTPTPAAWTSITAHKDTYVDRYSPSTAHGTEPILVVAYTGTTDEKVTLIEFDMGPWSQNTPDDLQTAILRVYLEAGEGTVRVFRMLRKDWTEDATWLTRDGASAWNASGLQSGTDYSATGPVSVSLSAPGWYAIDVTDLVKDAMLHNPTYFGPSIRK